MFQHQSAFIFTPTFPLKIEPGKSLKYTSDFLTRMPDISFVVFSSLYSNYFLFELNNYKFYYLKCYSSYIKFYCSGSYLEEADFEKTKRWV